MVVGLVDEVVMGVGLKAVKPFRIFSDSIYERWTGEWKNAIFAIRQTGLEEHPRPTMVLTVPAAEELIDALQKFVAASQVTDR